MSVSDKLLPPDILFKIVVVSCPTLRFFVLVIPIKGAVAVIAGFRNLFQAVCVPLKIICSLLLIDPPSSIYLCGGNVINF